MAPQTPPSARKKIRPRTSYVPNKISDFEDPIWQRYHVHPSPVVNIRTYKIMNGWTASGLVSINLATAFIVAATAWEARTNKDGRYRSIRDSTPESMVIGSGTSRS